jgi:hypothetical protein
MQIEYALTFEEWREAYAPVTGSSKPAKKTSPAFQLISWLLLFALSILELARPSVSYARGLPPSENLWVMLTASLCVATFFASESIASALLKQQTRGGKPITLGGAQAVGTVTMLAYIWIIPVWFPQLAIYWHPTDNQKVWAAFAPWFLYLAITRYILARRRARAMEQLWNKSASLKRTNHARVTSDGVVIDDGYTEHRYRWNYMQRYRETLNMVVLTTIDTGTILLPKRAVPDDSAMDEMKMLISENVPDGKFLQKPQAFAVIVSPAPIAGDSGGAASGGVVVQASEKGN